MLIFGEESGGGEILNRFPFAEFPECKAVEDEPVAGGGRQVEVAVLADQAVAHFGEGQAVLYGVGFGEVVLGPQHGSQ